MTISLVNTKRHRNALLTLACTLFAIGCADEIITGTVKGKLQLGTEPYTNAAVVFQSPETGRGATGNVQEDGTFSLSMPLQPGKYLVYLAPKAVEPPAGDKAVAPKGAEGPMSISESSDEAVPSKYWNETTTDISIDVVAGENDVTVQLNKE